MNSFCSNFPRRLLLVPVQKKDGFLALSPGGWDSGCAKPVLRAAQRLQDEGLLVSSGCEGAWKSWGGGSGWSSYLAAPSPSPASLRVAASLLPSPDLSARLRQTRPGQS